MTPPTATYAVQHGAWDYAPEVLIASARSVTGKLHVHRVVNNSGVPYQFSHDRITLLGLTLAQMLTVKGLAGKRVYYVPNYHDDAALTPYIITGYLIIGAGAIQNVDPMGTFWNIQGEILDDDTVP